jgi:hypothetical protein
VAIDLEMTGLFEEGEWARGSSLDTIQSRYCRSRASADKFAMLQLGIAACTWVAAPEVAAVSADAAPAPAPAASEMQGSVVAAAAGGDSAGGIAGSAAAGVPEAAAAAAPGAPGEGVAEASAVPATLAPTADAAAPAAAALPPPPAAPRGEFVADVFSMYVAPKSPASKSETCFTCQPSSLQVRPRAAPAAG